MPGGGYLRSPELRDYLRTQIEVIVQGDEMETDFPEMGKRSPKYQDAICCKPDGCPRCWHMGFPEAHNPGATWHAQWEQVRGPRATHKHFTASLPWLRKQAHKFTISCFSSVSCDRILGKSQAYNSKRSEVIYEGRIG